MFRLRRNAILSQPAADSPFHWIAVSGFAAYGYRVPLAGKRGLFSLRRDGGAYFSPIPSRK